MNELNIDALPIKTALISVSDRTGLDILATELDKRDIRMLATGGTAKYIQELGFWVTEISEYTDFPEIMNGRVKTLHPMVHGGLLANRDDKKHLAAMHTHQIQAIDLAIINLYPFAKVIAENPAEAVAIENIDIGGPSMTRSAAKNHRWVTVLSDPALYGGFIKHLQENAGATNFAYRQNLAAEAFTKTAIYDSLISLYLSKHKGDDLPDTMVQVMHKAHDLSYGENPHQKAAVYLNDTVHSDSLSSAKPLHGKPLSYNNLLDSAAALRAIASLTDPAVVIVKHNTPCGLAVGKNAIEAFHKACACDPLSAFGGVVAMNKPLNAEMIDAWGDLFLEVVITPEVDRSLLPSLAKRKNLRIIETKPPKDPGLLVRSIQGGILVQQSDKQITPRDQMRVVTDCSPDEKTWQDLLFAWEAIRHVKSNAVVFARDRATVAIGGGQTSRFYAIQAAINNSSAYQGTHNSVLASDAFFPFPDAIEAAIAAGIKAIIQPGGAMRDNALIAIANQHKIPMVFTGVRHFCH